MRENPWFIEPLKEQKSELLKTVFLNACSNTLQIFVSLFAMAVYNKVLPNFAISSLVTLSIGIGIIVLIDLIFKLLKSRIASISSDTIEAALQPALFRKVLSWDLDNKPHYSGSSSTLIRDLETICELITNSTITTIIGIPFVIVNLVVVAFIAGPLAYLVVLIVIVTFSASIIFYIRASSIAPDTKQASIDKNGIFLEAIQNLETLKSLGNYEYFTTKWNEADRASRNLNLKNKILIADANAFNTFFSSFAQVSVVAFGGFLVISGEISSGALIASVILNGKTIQPVIQLASFLQRLSSAKMSFARLSKTYATSSKEEMRRKNISIKSIEPKIRADNLQFQPEGLTAPIFSAKKLIIPENQRVGIIGPVGSGKSTLLKLLAGVFTPTTGTICYGAFDTTAINQADLRRDVAYMGQNPGVFGGTIRDNITLGDDRLTEEQILHSMKLTGFDTVLKKFPNGLSFFLSENGSQLSGGQKQVLALTRVLISEPKVLLLDEPTSAMDPRHEQLFIAQIKRYVQDKSLIVVTHRKPILSLTERLILVENGEIKLDGPRDEILRKLQ